MSTIKGVFVPENVARVVNEELVSTAAWQLAAESINVGLFPMREHVERELRRVYDPYLRVVTYDLETMQPFGADDTVPEQIVLVLDLDSYFHSYRTH